MNLTESKNTILISFITKFWWLIMTYQFLKNLDGCMCIEDVESQADWMDDNERISFPVQNYSEYYFQETTTPRKKYSTDEKNRSCRYFNSSYRLICVGSIDFPYLETLQDKQIEDFIVEKYEAESVYKKKYWSSKNLKTGEWYTKLPKVYEKLKGEVQLKNTGVIISVILNLIPHKNVNGFLIDGQAFSNKVLKISWKLRGNLHMDFVKNRTIIQIDVRTVSAGDSAWKIQSNLTFARRNDDSDIDEWKAVGILKSDYISENQFLLYRGDIWTRMMKGECRFSGEVNLKSVNLVGALFGSVSPPLTKEITIPKSAFSNMSIRNVEFKDSKFYYDFDKDSFEGLDGVESVTFINSKLEMMPKLNELFSGFMNLKEIYIEDCVTTNLKFGIESVLKEVKRLSFQGSGPLFFTDISFVWLKNSNLSYLSLKNSHVKLSLKGNSVLWPVNNTLKYLDISYSTLTDEKDLTSILSTLSIKNLVAEGLQLRKVPTAALKNVRNTLQYLSLRGSYFRKILEKNMFDTMFNFPYMPELKELNLMECHINFLEQGAFDNLPNLKVLHLSYNNLDNIQYGWVTTKPQIIYLDLSHNGFTSQTTSIFKYDLEPTMDMSMFEKLEVLNLSNGIFTNINKLVGSLGNNIRNLSLSNTNLEDFSENIFQNLTRLETLDMSYNRNIKTIQSFSFDLFKNLTNLKTLILNSCRISNAVIFEDEILDGFESEAFTLENLEHLDLSGNNIKILSSETLKLFPKLKILNLSSNSVTMWKANVFSFNRQLETIFLHENKIETITADMIADILKLKHISLGNNPFICGPYVYEILKLVGNVRIDQFPPFGMHKHIEFSNDGEMVDENKDLMRISANTRYSFLRKLSQNFKGFQDNNSATNNEVYFLDWSEYNYVCYSWSQAKFIPFPLLRETFDDLSNHNDDLYKATLLWLPVIIVIGVVVTAVIISWKYLDVHLITRAVRNAIALSFIGSRDKEPEKYEYNVFVSYSDSDRSWVIDNLIPRLESRSDVKVCLHERDFQVGLSIMENIIASIDRSKNIILVLSQAFLKSQWCQYEMHLAQHRLLEKGRDQLTLIFLENIPLMKRPKILRFLMMTKTYLEWPANPKSDKDVELFWDRLINSVLKLN